MRLDLGGPHDCAVIGALQKVLNFRGKTGRLVIGSSAGYSNDSLVNNRLGLGVTGLHKNRDRRERPYALGFAWPLEIIFA
jgi:hypothetical protein